MQKYQIRLVKIQITLKMELHQIATIYSNENKKAEAKWPSYENMNTRVSCRVEAVRLDRAGGRNEQVRDRNGERVQRGREIPRAEA